MSTWLRCRPRWAPAHRRPPPCPALTIIASFCLPDYLDCYKDTSLAANITVVEMFMTAQRVAGRTYEHLALYAEVALIYLLFCTVITRLQALGEKKLSRMNGGDVIRA